ncbi:MAG: hypothetical protein ABSB69_10890 [Solirubrobacteraceae bacterium]
MSDLFGRKGRVWLAEQQLPEEEAETVQGCLRQIDFVNGEIAQWRPSDCPIGVDRRGRRRVGRVLRYLVVAVKRIV